MGRACRTCRRTTARCSRRIEQAKVQMWSQQGGHLRSKGRGHRGPARSTLPTRSRCRLRRARLPDSQGHTPPLQSRRVRIQVPPHFFFLPLMSAGSGSSGWSAAFCTPSAFAIMTKEMPPTMLLAPRITEVMMRNMEEGRMGCRTCGSSTQRRMDREGRQAQG